MGSGSVFCSLKFTECALQYDASRSTKPAWVILVEFVIASLREGSRGDRGCAEADGR